MSKDVKTQSAPLADPDRKPSAAEREWEEKTLRPSLEKSPERDADFTTVSSYPIRRLYTQADLPGWNPETDLGFPGQPPLASIARYSASGDPKDLERCVHGFKLTP